MQNISKLIFISFYYIFLKVKRKRGDRYQNILRNSAGRKWKNIILKTKSSSTNSEVNSSSSNANLDSDKCI
uniref:Uncharacterized protein n=1 Tax=Meloidogyne enterolobii TaxID=390850 RepID=A0A6V7V2F8_MELEN|nr:unnamed protein product [Meloidogyne enterolobii]